MVVCFSESMTTSPLSAVPPNFGLKSYLKLVVVGYFVVAAVRTGVFLGTSLEALALGGFIAFGPLF